MMLRWYRNLGLLAGSMVSTLLTGQAYGQASTDRTGGGLEEIIITAERRSDDVQKTATSVAVRSGDALQAEGKFTLRQVLEDVAGVTALPSSNFNSATSGIGITIRGAGAQTGRGGQLPRIGAAHFQEARA